MWIPVTSACFVSKTLQNKLLKQRFNKKNIHSKYQGNIMYAACLINDDIETKSLFQEIKQFTSMYCYMKIIQYCTSLAIYSSIFKNKIYRMIDSAILLLFLLRIFLKSKLFKRAVC